MMQPGDKASVRADFSWKEIIALMFLKGTKVCLKFFQMPASCCLLIFFQNKVTISKQVHYN